MQLGCINSCFLSPEDCDNQLEQFSQGLHRTCSDMPTSDTGKP